MSGKSPDMGHPIPLQCWNVGYPNLQDSRIESFFLTRFAGAIQSTHSVRMRHWVCLPCIATSQSSIRSVLLALLSSRRNSTYPLLQHRNGPDSRLRLAERVVLLSVLVSVSLVTATLSKTEEHIAAFAFDQAGIRDGSSRRARVHSFAESVVAAPHERTKTGPARLGTGPPRRH